MIFYYPINAITTKDIYRFTYLSYDAIGINLNKYNNDSSNTFYLIDSAAIELERILFDINYQFNPALDNIDFITIDRINRFYNKNIPNIVYDSLSGTVKCNNPIIGFSKYTNKSYTLENVNKFTDFTRHSYPCDIFLEEGYTVGNQASLIPVLFTAEPNIKFVFNIPISVAKSKISVNIEDTNIKNMLLLSVPYLIISGYDSGYKRVKEQIYINSINDIVSKNEFVEVTDVLLVGTTDKVNFTISPFVKSKTAKLEYGYIDREEQYGFDAVYSIDIESKSLLINRVDETFAFPGLLDKYEEIELDLPDNSSIVDYYFDEPNKILNVISISASGKRAIGIFPLIQPFNRANIGLLKRTQSQNVKVSYAKDTISKLYSFVFNPALKTHGVDELNVAIVHLHNEEKGQWKAQTDYSIGNLVEYASSEYIAITDHTSDQYFDIDNFILKTEYIIQGMVLDLLTYGLENNKLEINFDRLFSLNDECIVQIETSGYENCMLQVLCQYEKLRPILTTNLVDLHDNPNPGLFTPDQNTISPIENNNLLLLSENINGYNTIIDNIYSESDDTYIYKLSSTNKTYISGKSITYVFNTFYLDWENSCIITSDTITHVIN